MIRIQREHLGGPMTRMTGLQRRGAGPPFGALFPAYGAARADGLLRGAVAIVHLTRCAEEGSIRI
jgi:hypothetical protein